jgi:hypothetical protein
MSYSRPITRTEPSLLLFLIDQSGSMTEQIANSNTSKAQYVADAINRAIYQLAVKATRDSSGPRHYFDIGVIGYGASVGAGWIGSLATAVVHPLPLLANQPARTETRTKRESDGAGGILEVNVEFPMWVEQRAGGGTPTAEAMEVAARETAAWIANHPTSFPPTVIHITDGQHSTSDPEPMAEMIRSLQTQDGQVLLFNIHVDSKAGASILFPSSPHELPDEHARKLFAMSSAPIGRMAERIAREFQTNTGAGTRFFGYRCDAIDFIRLLDIGTPDAAGGDR